MSFGSDSSSGGQQVDPALQRFIAEETEKQKMQVEMTIRTQGRNSGSLGLQWASQTNCDPSQPPIKQSNRKLQGYQENNQNLIKNNQCSCQNNQICMKKYQKTIKFDQNGYQTQKAPPPAAPFGRGRARRSCV